MSSLYAFISSFVWPSIHSFNHSSFHSGILEDIWSLCRGTSLIFSCFEWVVALFLLAYFPDRYPLPFRLYHHSIIIYVCFHVFSTRNVSVHCHACWRLSSKRPCHDRIQPDQLIYIDCFAHTKPLTGCDFCDVFGILTLWLFKVGPVWWFACDS